MNKRKYNHCKYCQKWLGWSNWAKFWTTQQLCEECQIKRGIF